MKIKLDENLPHQLVQLLTDLGHDVDTVPAEHLAGRDDDVVWAAAQTAGRLLVMQDLDFSDARKYAPGFRVATTIPDCTEGRPDAGDEYRESVRYDVAVVVRTIVAPLGETDDVADRFERRRGDLAAHETEVRQSLGRGLAMGGV